MEPGPIDPQPDDLPPCPACGGTLRLELRFRTVNSLLGGSMMKLGAQLWPYLACTSEACTFLEEGKYGS